MNNDNNIYVLQSSRFTSCSDIICTHCIPLSTGSLSIKLSSRDGSGSMSTCNSAGLSEKLHCFPNSALFFVYTYTISMIAHSSFLYRESGKYMHVIMMLSSITIGIVFQVHFSFWNLYEKIIIIIM